VNQRFAEELRRSSAGRTVLVEDYHLMLVATALSESGRSSTGPLAYFHHVPWCPPSYFALLPREIRVEIVSGLLTFDTLGFHARRWADQFLASCVEVLPDVHCTADAVTWRDRTVPVVVAPAQLDVPHLRREAGDAATARWRDDTIGRLTGPRVVARVDRLDLWKNVVRGFRAFEHLLDQGHDDLTFVALVARSRIHLPEYRRYLAACQREADRINGRLGRADRGPIRLMVADVSNHHRALAVLGLADVVLANSTSDGLNLVAKEAVIAGDGGSRIVLSETTGVHEEIGRWAWTVNPFDVEETGRALASALDAPARQPDLLTAVERNSPDGWIRRRLAGLTPAGSSA
jgi:trehalose 6-phosphate synthase